MSDQYAHGLAADWRQRHAMSTADKVGSAFVGWKPREPRKVSSWWLALGAALLVFAAIRSGL